MPETSYTIAIVGPRPPEVDLVASCSRNAKSTARPAESNWYHLSEYGPLITPKPVNGPQASSQPRRVSASNKARDDSETNRQHNKDGGQSEYVRIQPAARAGIVVRNKVSDPPDEPA